MTSQAKRGRPSGGGPRVGHLDSLSGILAEMGAVYREMRTGKTAIEVHVPDRPSDVAQRYWSVTIEHVQLSILP